MIEDALARTRGFVSARQLHLTIAAEGSRAGLATVYRQLNAMVASGHADTVAREGEQLFRICATGRHHHHLVCDGCGRTVQIHPPDESWVQKVAKDHGYTVNDHIIEIFGRCPTCAD